MITQEQVVAIVRAKGPVLPAQVSKEIGTNILIASAYLAELTDTKKILISRAKIGGSPVYYIKGQEHKLQQLYENLNEKDQRAFDLLKGQKVLVDAELSPLMRVALRNIKDFAVPLQVTYNEEKILFWKWYLLSNEEASEFIKTRLQPEPIAETKQESDAAADIQEKSAEVLKEKDAIREIKPISKPEQIQKERELTKEMKPISKIEVAQKEMLPATEQRAVSEQIPSRLKEEIPERKIEPEQRKIEPIQKTVKEEQRAAVEEKIIKEPRQDGLELKKAKPELKKIIKQQRGGDILAGKVSRYFASKGIEVIDKKAIRKTETDMVLKIPSVVGTLEYYCKVKDKKTITDADLSNVFVQGQVRRLPAMLLTTGELTKKAKELMGTDFKKCIVVNKL